MRAEAEITRLSAEGKATLKMRCVLGEITANADVLKGVWRDSGRRFARA